MRRPLVASLLLIAAAPLGAATATTADLGGGDRWRTYVSLDKPIYRIGETVYLRGVLMHQQDHHPLGSALQGYAQIDIKGPKGETVATSNAGSQDSIIGWTWTVPEQCAGGTYKVVVSYPSLGLPPAEREFEVRAFRAPRLKTDILFLRDGYGPGDEVDASLHVERAEDGFPAGANVEAVARVGGEEVWRGATTVAADGSCRVRFQLPSKLASGDGTLALVVADGGARETAAKTIPILLDRVDLAFFPEGGDLVAGLRSTVYLEARNAAQKPADIAGAVVDADGHEVARVRTEHEGRGRFAFTPAAGASYRLRIDQPAKLVGDYALPAAKPDGALIAAAERRYAANAPIRLVVSSTRAAAASVTLSKQEITLASADLDLTSGGSQVVELTPPAGMDGVFIATLWDAHGQPLSERLVFREPSSSLHLSVTPDHDGYVPGQPVTLKIAAHDDQGHPVRALVGLTVSDDSVAKLVDPRERAPDLRAMALLEDEVRELRDARVYLDRADARSDQALDLLLGTQGWRRFALVDVAAFRQRYGDAALRALAVRVPPPPVVLMEEAGANGLALGAPMPARAEWKAGAVARDGAALPPAAAAPVVTDEVLGVFQEDDAKERAQIDGLFANRAAAVRRQQPAAIRVYAHRHQDSGERRDFADTVYWSAGVATDAATGEATVSFQLSDAVTSFRIGADAFAAAGQLGGCESMIVSRQPLAIEAKLPLEVTAGDRVLAPVSVTSAVGGEAVEVRASGDLALGVAPSAQVALKDGRGRAVLPIEIGAASGTQALQISAAVNGASDAVRRSIAVVPAGFPISLNGSGLVAADDAAQFEFALPDSMAPGSLHATAVVYPTPLASLTGALESLIQEPYGCFEQTSSTTYPLVMAQQYFTTHQGVDPQLIARAGANLDKGYQRLIGFETKGRGYEWFGADPGHEALTAYGLLEFTDMGRTRAVDAAMVSRTREWLLAKRNGKGGYARNQAQIDSFGGAPQDITDAYITWALAEAGEQDIAKELAALAEKARSSDDSYLIALAANALADRGDQAAAAGLMARLAKAQDANGFVRGASTSITRSGGEALAIETTALAALAWLRADEFAAQAERAMRAITGACKGGRFGSTQSTVLALRAIMAYDRSRSHPAAPGSLELVVDGKPFGSLAFDDKAQGQLALPDAAKALAPGRHTLAVRMAGGSRMPYAISVSYHAAVPASSPKCALDLAVSLPAKTIAEGEPTEATVTIANRANAEVASPIAIVGLPGGLEPRHEQLKELVKAGRIAAYEVRGRELILYWRGFGPKQELTIPVSLIAAIPGSYTAPASRAYLYYTDEDKRWTDPLTIEITPK